ncbi:MAG: hypothetical protein M3441_08385 [Chloroflexota bacterium]|nr:hypothetical protein [Chloroflexota bacterium]
MSNRSRRGSSGIRAGRSSQSRQVAARPAAALVAAGVLTALVLTYVTLLFAAPTVLPPFMRWGLGPTAPEASPEGRISFVRLLEGQAQSLFVVNPDGTNQQQVTHDITIDQSQWSPDGRYIVAQAQFNNVAAILRVEVGPDNKRVEILNLTDGDTAESVFPAWSPDGTQIAVQSKRGGGDWQIHVMKADGSDKRMVTDGKGQAKFPTWSPDSQSIAYVLSDGQSAPGEIHVIPAAGGAARALTSNGSVKTNPIWTRDGQSIVFAQGSGDRIQTIAVVPAAGGEPRDIIEPASVRSIQLSPVAPPRLAYHRVLVESQGTDILTVPLDGGTPTVVTPDNEDDYLPSWSPDGSRLTWASNRPENPTPGYKIVVGNVDGSGVKVISSGAGTDFQPQWAPAAK